MLYRLKLNTSVVSYDTTTKISNPDIDKEQLVNDTGSVFTKALNHIPQTVDQLARKILSVFVEANKETIINDLIDFYDNFVREGFIVKGETYADCNAMEYGWGYDKDAALKAEKNEKQKIIAHYHLPGLFELYDLYKRFIPIFYNYREFFYDWCDIGSIYGCPSYSIWNSGRIRKSNDRKNVLQALALVKEFNISARFTFSNSLIEEKHLNDTYCNYLLEKFHDKKNGIILTSSVLKNYIQKNYPKYWFTSSITKCLDTEKTMLEEVSADDFKIIVIDYNFNNNFKILEKIPNKYREKVELLCNESCAPYCKNRSLDYEAISYDSLYLDNKFEKDWDCPDKRTNRKNFSTVKKNSVFISIENIQNKYLPEGFSHFKIEGRDYGELRLLEELIYYMVKPEYQLEVREMMYLKRESNFPKE